MKVILCEDVANLGEMGNTIKVAAGYARNYLIPRKMAVQADSATAKQIEHEMHIIRRKADKRRAEMQEFAKKIEGITVEIKAKAGEEEKLFGAVTSGHIADKLKEQGIEIDKKSILLDEPIKALGIFTVPVKLVSGIEASLKVWVSAEEEAE